MRYNQSVMGAFSGRLTSFLGGIIFSKNGTARTYNTPTNPQTAAQNQLRAVFAFLNAAWSGTLTDAERATWEAARTSTAAWQTTDPFTGTSRPYASAKAFFISINTNKMIVEGSLASPSVGFATVPAIVGNDTLGFTSLVANASAGTVVLTYGGTISLENLYLRVSPPVSAGVTRLTSVKSKLRSLLIISDSSPVSLGAEYVALFGAITAGEGNKIFYTLEAISVDDGRRRIIATGSTTIVA